MPTLLTAIMALLPLDETCAPAITMAMMPEHVAAGWKTPILDTYHTVSVMARGGGWVKARERSAARRPAGCPHAPLAQIVDRAEGRTVRFAEEERFAFYERAKKAYAVVSTG